MLNHITTSLLFFVGVYMSMWSTAGFEFKVPEGFTTPKDFDVHNTKAAATGSGKEITTDIPQAVIDDALNLDVGKYSTMSFHYFNHQNDNQMRPNLRCFNDHLKCILTQLHPAPVCAVNYGYSRRYITFPSYCHAYLDNCRRRTRYWVIHRLGPCQWFNMENECRDFIYESCP